MKLAFCDNRRKKVGFDAATVVVAMPNVFQDDAVAKLRSITARTQTRVAEPTHLA
jgi:hypothetical protein